jgi:hypothetical protein
MSESTDYRIELWATVLLSVATLLTAWSAFQANKWGGVMSIHFSEANAARTESAEYAAQANAERTVDVTVFVSYIEAVATKNTEESAFISKRFRSEFKPAFDAWVATHPRTNDSAPPTPFAMPQYRLASEQRSAALAQLADRRGQEARDANQQGDDYVLLTVVFASVLFFSGISTKLGAWKPQVALLGFATLLLLGALAVGITYPIQL